MTNWAFHGNRHWVLVAILLGVVPWASKAEVQVCPLQAPARATKPDVVPPGWEARVREGARLTTAGILVGPYDGSGYLAPEKSQVRQDGESEHFTQTWDFGPPTDVQKWVYCAYGGGLELYKRLPDQAKACTMNSTVYKGRTVAAMGLRCDL